MISTDEAIAQLRADPRFEETIRDSYLGADTAEAAARFERSGEFVLVREILGDHLVGAEVLDLGAGTGIGSFALARAGARRVIAVEPDPSEVVGRGALAGIAAGLPIEVMSGVGEELPLADASVDTVYLRQVLHHIPDPAEALAEVRRVLCPGGLFLACREHVVDDDEELERFLAEHPVHRLAGGEGAHPLPVYTGAIEGAGLELLGQWAMYESLINAFPVVRSVDELAAFRRQVLGPRLDALSTRAPWIPGVSRAVERKLAPYTPAGRMYSFLARAPGP